VRALTPTLLRFNPTVRVADRHLHIMVEHRQTEVLSIVGAFTVLAFVFVVVRVYSRYLGRNFGWDDYLIVGGMVLLLGQTIAMWKCMFSSLI
jgi:hypothetical protein